MPRPVRSLLLLAVALIAACDSATAPEPVPTTVDITPTTLAFTAIGQAQSLSAQVRDQNGNAMSGVAVTWSSSASTVVDVSASGEVTARGNGTAQVTARAGNAAGSATVQVAQTAATLALSSSALTFASFGETRSLTGEVRDANGNTIAGAAITWTSSATSVAEVSASGLVTARGNGAAQITARSGTLTSTASVQVTQVPASVVIAPASVTFDALGDTRELTAQVRDANANPISGQTVSWATSASTVAEVSGTGVVTARGNGTAQVTARVGTTTGAANVQVTQTVSQLVRVSGDQQRAAPGAQLAQELVVETRDRLGSPVPGASIAFSVTSGNGTVAPATITTNAQGRAAARWTLGSAVGVQGARAVTSAQQVTFTATAEAPPAIASIISGLSVEGVSGVARNGTPAVDPLAPALTVTGASTIIPGGGAQFDVTGAAPFSTLYVFVQGQSGYYEIDLSSLPMTSPWRSGAAEPAQLINTTIVMQNGTTLPGAAYVFEFAGGRGFGAGTRTTRPVSVQSVGTGGVQVSVSWNSRADVDLYLVEPSGETIWYGNEESATGGVLDLDSNAACFGADLRNENINWPTRTPPAGTYTVRVNYWDACGAARTDWLLTVRVPGQATRTFTGTFTGPGVGGEQNAGQVVTTFTVSASGVTVAPGSAIATPSTSAEPVATAPSVSTAPKRLKSRR